MNMNTTAVAIITEAEIIDAFGQIESAAIGSGLDADGRPDGSDDWNHHSADAARTITELLGMTWEFTTWADAEELALARIR